MTPDSDTILPLFVYGTLLPGESNYRFYLAGRTRNEQPATQPGTLYLVQEEGYPYLRPGRGIVHGVLADLVPQVYAATLAAIDRLEDFEPQAPETSLYLRQVTRARLGDGRQIRAWTYFWNSASEPGVLLPHGDFRRRDTGGRGARQPAEH